jgi:lipopolysaccharide transport system ATP-binding protein
MAGLSKRYEIGVARSRHDTLRDQIAAGFKTLFRMNGHKSSSRVHNTFWALRNVSFEVKRGDVVGIIGKNGAGKSTLLKILSRITEPTEGRAEIYGRLSSLLEVGTGFHRELTGRENIYLNGAILGMRKAEIDRKFDDIVSFADIEKFIDTPVKHYSSGMYVRLAFAVAAHLEPEILVIDEVLAVGDVGFQQKCLGKMGEVASQGRTVLFVSHNMAAVENLCTRAFMLQEGQLVFGGSTKETISHYLRFVSEEHSAFSHITDLRTAASRPKQYTPVLTRLEFLTEHGTPLQGGLAVGGALKLRISACLEKPTAYFSVALRFADHVGHRVLVLTSLCQPRWPEDERVGEQTVECNIPSLTLVPGDYRIEVLFDIGPEVVDHVENAARLTVLPADYYGTGKIPKTGTFVLKHHWRLI